MADGYKHPGFMQESLAKAGKSSKPARSKKSAYQRRKERDQVYRDLGMTKVRGAVSGRTYWE